MSDAYEQITKENDRRHRHNEDQPRCRNCSNFLSVPDNETGQLRVQCTNCNRWQLRYVNPKRAKSD